MTNKAVGWGLGMAALASMLGLMAADVKALHAWADIFTPAFVGNMMAHLSVVIMAFIGGKLIPTEPQDQRKDDIKTIRIADLP